MMFDNDVFKGDTLVSQLGPQPNVHQTWITYTYYKLEADLKKIKPAQKAYNKLLEASSWSDEYFSFLYNTVGRDYKWWYMNYIPKKELREYLTAPDKKYITLLEDKQPAGFAIIRDHINAYSNLEYFGLLPSFIGKGLGLTFLNDCLYVASQTADRMWVYTTSLDHPAALRTYQRVGFEILEQKAVSEYYPSNILTNNPR